MKDIETLIIEAVKKAITLLYNASADTINITCQRTKKEFEGDFTIVVFSLTPLSRKNPEQTGKDIGGYLQEAIPEVESYNVVEGFLSLSIRKAYWGNYLAEASAHPVLDNRVLYNQRGIKLGGTIGITDEETVMVEYSCPNTNKPLHLGHIRNNLIGLSISRILEATGKKVIKANLINDRGIHICKSMLAWLKWGNNATPESTGKKGDHLVGDYYVLFDKKYKEELKQLMAEGMGEEEAKNKSQLMAEARELLRKWEAGDTQTVNVWKMMNGWVYQGFDVTNKRLGVSFDKVYYESETYMLGKKIVNEGLEKGVFFKKPDGSVWIDLTAQGLDEKLVLRADGTSVYITQDIGTAVQRAKEFNFSNLIYVVGNEQEYHFKVLFLILKKLGCKWANGCYHLSYGMVELPEGKMKSREGTVVDADDLMDEMVKSAEEITRSLGKIENFESAEAAQLYNTIGMGALKYFMLKVDPKKKILFNPRESIDFEGNTGPFIQYTYTRICSLLHKAEGAGWGIGKGIFQGISDKEKDLIIKTYEFASVVNNAATAYNPSLVANYVYELAKEYNQFYHDFPILKQVDGETAHFRLDLSAYVGKIIHTAFYLLGIEAPEKM